MVYLPDVWLQLGWCIISLRWWSFRAQLEMPDSAGDARWVHMPAYKICSEYCIYKNTNVPVLRIQASSNQYISTAFMVYLPDVWLQLDWCIISLRWLSFHTQLEMPESAADARISGRCQLSGNACVQDIRVILRIPRIYVHECTCTWEYKLLAISTFQHTLLKVYLSWRYVTDPILGDCCKARDIIDLSKGILLQSSL